MWPVIFPYEKVPLKVQSQHWLTQEMSTVWSFIIKIEHVKGQFTKITHLLIDKGLHIKHHATKCVCSAAFIWKMGANTTNAQKGSFFNFEGQILASCL